MKNSLFDLSGRVALVTGGSKGLGKAMARAFAEAGADVVIASRHEDELKAALAEIGRGREVRGKYCRGRHDPPQRGRSAGESRRLAEFGRVDILVNNAGSNVPEEIDKITDANWDRIVELNLSSCMALTRALVPQMKSRKWGRVIHISSIMGLASKAGRDAYSATKSALIGLARAGTGTGAVRHHGQLPGPRSVFDRSARQDFERRGKGGLRRTDRRRPLGRPRELAGPALLLASEPAATSRAKRSSSTAARCA